MRIVRILCPVIFATVLIPTPAVAGPIIGPGTPDSPPAPQTGPITVEYETEGGTSTTTSIQSGSAFRNQGGGDRAPCTFTYYADLDGDGLTDADAVAQPVDSDRWVFKETTQNALDLNDSEWETVAAIGGKTLAETVEQYGSVDTAFRRFDVFCNGTQGSGTVVNQFQGSILVSINDPFWGYRARLDALYAQIAWPRIDRATVPTSSTFGGLPVNMPANFQINSAAWGSFFSPTSSYRGWTSQIVVTAVDVEFALTFDPDDGPAVSIDVPCVNDFGDLAGSGWIPKRGVDVPDFAEPGQYAAPCVWIPPSPGELTAVAEVTYQARSVVVGPPGRFRENLNDETRTSAPLVVRVDELSIVNVQPNGVRAGGGR
jgi:hypothetical protein